MEEQTQKTTVQPKKNNNKKWWLWLIVIIVLISGWMLWVLFAIEDNTSSNLNAELFNDQVNKYITECEVRVKGTAQDKPFSCYTKAALFEFENISICSRIPDVDGIEHVEKLNCYNQFAAMASLDNNICICEDIPDSSERLERIKIGNCYGGVAYSTSKGDLDICNNLIGDSKYLDISLKDLCLTNVAYKCTIFWIYRISNPNPAPKVCLELMDQTGWDKDFLVEQSQIWF